MHRFDEYCKKYGFILGYLALAVLLSGAIRYTVWRQTDAWTKGLLSGGVILGALFILANPRQARAFLTQRSTRYASNAILMSIAFISILIGLNYLAGRYHRSYDVTELKEHTLSPQSIQVLADLEEPVVIVGFFAADAYQRMDFERLLDRYLDRSDKLSYEVIDPDREPLKAQQYESVPPRGGLLLQSGQRIQMVSTADEQDITSALLKVSSEEKKVIYFLTGHKEHDLEGRDEKGYSQVAGALRDQNYKVRTLNLAAVEAMPGDAAVIVAAGPQTELRAEEMERLQKYLAEGGKAFIMQDPLYDAGLNEVLANWQVRFGKGIVIDPASELSVGAAYPVVTRYRFSQITENMAGLMTFFPLARPVEQLGQDASGSLTFTSLAETSLQSWAEQDTEASEVRFDAGVDVQGPLALMASIEAPPDLKTRLVLVGDSDFASNEAVKGSGNETLFLNALNWLAEEESMISIGPKSTQPRQVFLSQIQASGIFFVSILLIPFALLFAGGVVWWKRR